jgi:5-enolpyruvylshikimate-3-phosphate synthase
LEFLRSKELNIKNVLLNERRIGFLKILRKMNADITIKDVEVKIMKMLEP